MPKRTDISKIMIIGSGPIIISQACEFDYSGTQACKALKEEGYEVVLVNSNPATIMTDPEMADHTYVEPITPEIVAMIIEKEKPDLVVLDIKMVDYNGLDLLQDIRNKYYDLPVILCTAYDTFKEDMKSIAADFYVIKSFDMTELKKKIKMALETSVPQET